MAEVHSHDEVAVKAHEHAHGHDEHHEEHHQETFVTKYIF